MPNSVQKIAPPESAAMPGSGFRRRTRVEFALGLDGAEIRIDRPRLVIGRSSAADVQLDGPLVSRLHAAISVTETGLVVEDLASRNGVFVNGVLIRQPLPLEPGDRVRIGEQDLEVRRLEGVDAPTVLELESADLEEEHSTRRVEPFELLRNAVTVALAAGAADEAEGLISGHLGSLLKQAAKSRSISDTVQQAATDYAMRLAEATGRGQWIDYIFELHLATARLLPLSTLRELFRLASIVRYQDRQVVSRYIDFLTSRLDQLGPNAAVVLERARRYRRL